MPDAPTTEAPTADQPDPGAGGPDAPHRPLRRCPHHRLVAGVAAGVADYLDVDRNAVRVALVLLTLVAGIGVPAYLAAWLLIPEEGADASLAEDLTDRWANR